ncbi:MAG: T9SS type A sorting domain-containing protein [Sphingobacteriales bacterium JAD_PAG50586_3]|nr:MAG: T9SS type A sorting domain-containing protein [Sphingobacteriales bacterium JAD_PAG50586_3]
MLRISLRFNFFSNTLSFVWHNLNGDIIKRKQLKRQGSSYYSIWHNSSILYNNEFITFTGYDDSLTFNPPNTGDILLVNYNLNGDTLWTKRYDSGFFDTGYAALQTENKSILGVGSSSLTGDGIPNISRAIKYDSLGNILWNKTYYSGATSSLSAAINSSDGNYYVGGQHRQWSNTYSRTMILKLDQDGELVWPKFLNNICDEYTPSLCLCSDGNLIVGGSKCVYQATVTSNPKQLLYLGKLSKVDGSTIWDTTYNTDIVGFNGLLFVQELTNGDILGGGTGYKMEVNGNDTTYNDLGVLIRTNSFGELIWKRYYNYDEGTATNCFLSSGKETPDGGFILAGRVRGTGFDDGWLLKTDANGCIDLSCVNGVEELDDDDFRLSIYPNPAEEYVSIDLPILYNKGILQVYNMQGQIVKIAPITTGGTQSFSISDMPNGIYQLVVYSSTSKLLGREKLVVGR